MAASYQFLSLDSCLQNNFMKLAMPYLYLKALIALLYTLPDLNFTNPPAASGTQKINCDRYSQLSDRALAFRSQRSEPRHAIALRTTAISALRCVSLAVSASSAYQGCRFAIASAIPEHRSTVLL
jgi:hypothetical protein